MEDDAGGPFTQQGVDADDGNSSGFGDIDVGRATSDPVGEFAVKPVTKILARQPVLAGEVLWRDTPAIRGPVTVPMTFRA